MNASTTAIAPANASVAVTRILSVDIFRGLTVLVMVFVNDVAEVKGLPWWTHYMPEGVSGMTYVDMVFSAFLFIVGISMPLAINRRLAMGDSYLDVLKHVMVRSLSLVAIGYILANLQNLDPQLTGVGVQTWDLLAFAGILLAWSVYPKSGTHRSLYRSLKASGLGERGVASPRYRNPYMERGSKRPDPPAVAHTAVRAAVAEAGRCCPGLLLVAGGKSFGGRMTSQAQAMAPLDGVHGLAFLGFPLHPAGKPSSDRASHLSDVH